MVNLLSVNHTVNKLESLKLSYSCVPQLGLNLKLPLGEKCKESTTQTDTSLGNQCLLSKAQHGGVHPTGLESPVDLRCIYQATRARRHARTEYTDPVCFRKHRLDLMLILCHQPPHQGVDDYLLSKDATFVEDGSLCFKSSQTGGVQ
jgi:hypothetical protein